MKTKAVPIVYTVSGKKVLVYLGKAIVKESISCVRSASSLEPTTTSWREMRVVPQRFYNGRITSQRLRNDQNWMRNIRGLNTILIECKIWMNMNWAESSKAHFLNAFLLHEIAWHKHLPTCLFASLVPWCRCWLSPCSMVHWWLGIEQSALRFLHVK